MVPAVGPRDARIMLVGEAPGEQEVLKKEPFVGPSGFLLNEMLHDAGLTRAQCFITNVARFRPPNNEINAWIASSKKAVTQAHYPLHGKMVMSPIIEGYEQLCQEIRLVSPNVIVAFGNVSMWALTGKWGIKSWRGSTLQTMVNSTLPSGKKVIPMYHPAYILRDYSQRHITIHDLRRAKRAAQSPAIDAPHYSFVIRPNYDSVKTFLEETTRQAESASEGYTISVDIETRAGHIACVGLAISDRQAICIPFMCVEDSAGYWPAEIEADIVLRLRRLLTHPNARVVGQNFIYDAQYFYRHWHFVPRFVRDTMLSHHTCFAGLPKGLDFLSSLYCEHHVYWKDEGKEWDTSIPEEQYWSYNCKDAVITYEAAQAIDKTTEALGLQAPSEFQNQMFWPVLQAMVRGVKVDVSGKRQLANELRAAISEREAWMARLLGHPINIRSPIQLKKLFYEDFAQKEIYNRATGAITLNDEALQKIGQREPILRPLVQTIAECRSLGVVLSNIGEARLDRDERLRCSYNIAGTETFRLSSSENAFGNGLNLQNLTKGLTKGAMRGSYSQGFKIPNTRKIFIPDDGCTFFSGDLDRADFQVVVWESDDAEFKAMLREGADVHTENARTLFSASVPTKPQRELAKRWVHGTNYGGKPRTMATACGITLHQAERLHMRWFQAHPGIQRWHDRTANQLKTKRSVSNKFGYVRHYFDRPDSLLNEALAWVPQSTVGLVINRIWQSIFIEHPEIEVLLQVHDELAGQFPTSLKDGCISILLDTARRIVVPYDDPLVIPFKVSTSEVSWGDCV